MDILGTLSDLRTILSVSYKCDLRLYVFLLNNLTHTSIYFNKL